MCCIFYVPTNFNCVRVVDQQFVSFILHMEKIELLRTRIFHKLILMMSQLRTRIVPELDFTVHDDTVLSLVEMVKCPIVLDVTDTMCIFNNNSMS